MGGRFNNELSFEYKCSVLSLWEGKQVATEAPEYPPLNDISTWIVNSIDTMIKPG